MLFNSIEFIIFLPVVFTIYWLLNNRLKWQNLFLVISSYFFYGWWDWKFLLLIVASTLIDYFTARAIVANSERSKKILLGISIAANLGILGFFKYYNFFLDNLNQAFTLLGKPLELSGLDIVLPVGISFYTFQTLSYTIDVYRGKIKPSNDFLSFSAYVCFFPQLVAGPIERAANFLPQFTRKRTFDYQNSADGLRQILWGSFKKIVVADTCAIYVDQIFGNPESFTSITLAMGVLLFAFQIYGDFSGYSDIAIGTANLFGFRLMKNFAYPYFSRDIAEFWRRWHISLSSWFRDYVYFPLGGSQKSKLITVRNIFIIFIVSGFWHGANWTFIVWGALNAILFLPLLLTNRNRKNLDTVTSKGYTASLRDIVNIIITFALVCFTWIFFRSNSLAEAVDYIGMLFTNGSSGLDKLNLIPVMIFVIFQVIFEWFQRHKDHGLQFNLERTPRLVRWSIYSFILLLISFHFGEANTFIYFQF